MLAFHIPIANDFTRILSIARLGKTGETYAFDREGRLLSESRFEEQLRAAGLLPPGLKSTLNIEIRDPGGNTLEGHRPEVPLQGAAAHEDGRGRGGRRPAESTSRDTATIAASRSSARGSGSRTWISA